MEMNSLKRVLPMKSQEINHNHKKIKHKKNKKNKKKKKLMKLKLKPQLVIQTANLKKILIIPTKNAYN